jgi:hypothetical protein
MVDLVSDHTHSRAGEKATGLSSVSSDLRAPARQHHLRLGVGLGCADLHRERSHSVPQETRRSGGSEIRYGQAKLRGREAWWIVRSGGGKDELAMAVPHHVLITSCAHSVNRGPHLARLPDDSDERHTTPTTTTTVRLSKVCLRGRRHHPRRVLPFSGLES